MASIEFTIRAGLGGPDPAAPHGQAEGTVDLEPGTYAAICVIPSADGTPHIAKGMAKALTVVPGPSTAEQMHELVLFRLVPRKTAEEIVGDGSRTSRTACSSR